MTAGPEFENSARKDLFGTDVASLVPMDLGAEPSDFAEDSEQGAGEVTAPAADLSGRPLPPGDTLDGLTFDEAADLALLQRLGDRGDD